MKKLLTVVCVALFAATLVMASCGGAGGNTPSSLAKQTYSEFQSALKADGLDTNAKGTDAAFAFALWAMAMDKDPTPAYAKIAEKIKKFSPADEEAYGKELTKLLGIE